MDTAPQPALPEISWQDIEPVLRPHATVANGRELHWIGWCWQILKHQGLTSYGSEAEKAMVLMRALVLMRVHQDYAYIMLEIVQSMEENVVFNELSAATGSTGKATLLWEHKRILDVLIENYVEWDPLVSTYDPSLADEYGYSVHEFLDDLKKTLPPGDEEEFVYPMLPEAFDYSYNETDGVESLADYHEWLADIRESHISVWLDANWVLPNVNGEYEEGIRLYFHAEWEKVEPFFRDNPCWGTEEEMAWYREMWDLMQDSGFTGYRFEFLEVSEAMVRLVLLYQSFCFLALDRPIAMKPDLEWEHLTIDSKYMDKDEVVWKPNRLVEVLIGAMLRNPKNRGTGRFRRFTVDGSKLFLRRAMASLPVQEKSLVRHYEAESAWRFDGPPGVEPKVYNAALLKERMERIGHWLETGEMPGTSGMEQGAEDGEG